MPPAKYRTSKIPAYREPYDFHHHDNYSDEQREFLIAMDAEKRRLGKLSLTPAEILRVAKRIGYRRVIDLREIAENNAAPPPFEPTPPPVPESPA